MTEPIRIGILSTANIARAAVCPAIASSDGAELAAVASRDTARARDFAERVGIPRAHGSYEALLDDPDVDAVYVALPNALHETWTVRALQAGKHVLCEKPLAPTVAACERMGAAADAAGRVLMEAFMYRFHPRVRSGG
ncbi:MAG: Gfo/Idh/MocA family oxidoreductase, partial [Trueperaceae bacterium]